MGDFKPQIPAIYGRMERGEIPRWLGLSAIAITWVFLIIPVLFLTSPIWGIAVAYDRLIKHGKIPPVNDDIPS